jgi:3-hydroxyacyl-CoA dehydrogenase
MGPFAVADMSGLQIAWAMRRRREQGTLPGRYVDIPDILCEAGRLGRRTGLGYYAYPEGGTGPVVDPEVTSLILKESARKGITRRIIADEEIVDRALFAMVNEACLALEEGVALRAGDVDVALVHGFGFPRHTGGPLWWASRLSRDRVETGIAAVAAAAGPSFRAGPLRAVLDEVRENA